MKTFCVFLIFATACFSLSGGESTFKCNVAPGDIPNSWVDMVDGCMKKMEGQVRMEVEAAMHYLSMGAYFAQDSVNRPGFSKLFFDAATEERGHAIKMIKYLQMRGQLTDGVKDLVAFPMKDYNLRQEWNSGIEALRGALELEANVTKSIRSVIMECENSPPSAFNDYHLADWLTGEFLDEQYKGQRDLAGKASTLSKMMVTHGALGEFIFDKKLLNNEL